MKKNPLAGVPVKLSTVKVVRLTGKRWVILWEDADFENCTSAQEAFDSITKRDKRRMGKTKGNRIFMTTIEWHSTPKGFKPPKEST